MNALVARRDRRGRGVNRQDNMPRVDPRRRVHNLMEDRQTYGPGRAGHDMSGRKMNGTHGTLLSGFATIGPNLGLREEVMIGQNATHRIGGAKQDGGDSYRY